MKTAVAFPNLQWAGWKGETEDGRVNTLRPVVLTHAGDGSNRVFVATQHGVIHVFPTTRRRRQITATTVFLDIQDRVTYKDETNEEGFLGLAFHPRFKENGYFYVFYTLKSERLTNIVSRFQVRKDDPSQADPASEVENPFKKPYWNHDGGTIIFGPDGFLYVTHGDGGAGNDPHENGQNLGTLLGKVLRIDVDHSEGGKNYAIPKDNPFVDRSDARPEIWAYGIRNIWRMAFDHKTGRPASSGRARSARTSGRKSTSSSRAAITTAGTSASRLHPFGQKGVGPRPELIDPIWEYYHFDTGKSITGGSVYRGPRLPELDGAYLYADYVSGRLWALRIRCNPTTCRREPPDHVSRPARDVIRRGRTRRGLFSDHHRHGQRNLLVHEVIPRRNRARGEPSLEPGTNGVWTAWELMSREVNCNHRRRILWHSHRRQSRSFEHRVFTRQHR